MRRIIVCRLLLLAAFVAAWSAAWSDAWAERGPKSIRVETNFENGEQIDPDAGLVVGESPAQAVLFGGAVEIRGVRSAYNTPPHAWVFDEGEAGTIEFETAVHELSFFSAIRANRGSTDPPNGAAFATLLDRRGEVIDFIVFLVSHEPGARVQVMKDGLQIPLIDGHPQTIFSIVPIGAVLFDHSATGQSFSALDDVSYEVRLKRRGRDDDDGDDD